MFTGLIQKKARLSEVRLATEHTPCRLVIELDQPWQDIELGESIAVDGCCLSVVDDEQLRPDQLAFDVSKESLARTHMHALKPGDWLNLERALRMGDRLGGHMVSGHVDTVATLAEAHTAADGHNLLFRVPGDYQVMLIEKGSVCINGISLTVNRVGYSEKTGTEWSVTIIPITWEHTNLRNLAEGAQANVEWDMMAKFAQRHFSVLSKKNPQ